MDIIEIDKNNVHRHPWELSRAGNILSLAVKTGLKAPLADIGSGDLYFASELKKVSGSDVTAVDEGYLTFKPENPQGLKTFTSVAELSNGSLGTVFLLDVLEHVKDDEGLLNTLNGKLAVDGKLIVTVPAYQFLFSEHDVHLKHKRRYNLNTLNGLLKRSGFETYEIFYFFGTLFIARLIQVFLDNAGFKASPEKSISAWKRPADDFLTRFVVFILNADFSICRMLSKLKIRLPGLSLCAVSKKMSSL